MASASTETAGTAPEKSLLKVAIGDLPDHLSGIQPLPDFIRELDGVTKPFRENTFGTPKEIVAKAVAEENTHISKVIKTYVDVHHKEYPEIAGQLSGNAESVKPGLDQLLALANNITWASSGTHDDNAYLGSREVATSLQYPPTESIAHTNCSLFNFMYARVFEQLATELNPELLQNHKLVDLSGMFASDLPREYQGFQFGTWNQDHTYLTLISQKDGQLISAAVDPYHNRAGNRDMLKPDQLRNIDYTNLRGIDVTLVTVLFEARAAGNQRFYKAFRADTELLETWLYNFDYESVVKGDSQYDKLRGLQVASLMVLLRERYSDDIYRRISQFGFDLGKSGISERQPPEEARINHLAESLDKLDSPGLRDSADMLANTAQHFRTEGQSVSGKWQNFEEWLGRSTHTEVVIQQFVNRIVEDSFRKIEDVIAGTDPESEYVDAVLLGSVLDFFTVLAQREIAVPDLYAQFEGVLQKLQERLTQKPELIFNSGFLKRKLSREKIPVEFPGNKVPGWISLREKFQLLADTISA